MNLRNLDSVNFKLLILTLLFSLLPAFSQDELDLKIGQMIIVSFAPGTDFEDTLYYDIEHRNLGGVILFSYNLHDPVQITNLTSNLQNSATIPLLIVTDQEGGYVARLDENNGFAETHSAYQLGTVIDNEDSTRSQANMMAQWLFDSGINTNLAPVVDVNVNPSSPAIGYHERSFSADPIKVFNHADWFISEFENFNLISTLKHFPGHGSAEQDSHLGFTNITTTWADSELVPYQGLISAGYSDMIMVGHLYNAHLDSIHPASLSESVITGLLRDSLGFQGVVTSDAMFMRAITDNYSFEEAIVLAINAGTDLLLYTSNEYNGSSLVAEVARVIRNSIDEGVISQNQIEESYLRIMAMKTRITGLASKTEKSIPESFSLHQNYPNPFNPITTIKYLLPIRSDVQITVFDLLGKQVVILKSETQDAGYKSVQWDASNVASGMYFYQIRVYDPDAIGAGEYVQTRKMILLK